MKKKMLTMSIILLFVASTPLYALPGTGGGAPIGGGLFILLGLGAAYGGKKLYQYKKQGSKE